MHKLDTVTSQLSIDRLIDGRYRAIPEADNDRVAGGTLAQSQSLSFSQWLLSSTSCIIAAISEVCGIPPGDCEMGLTADREAAEWDYPPTGRQQNGTIRRQGGSRMGLSADREAAEWDYPPTGRQQNGTIRRQGGSRMGPFADEEAAEWSYHRQGDSGIDLSPARRQRNLIICQQGHSEVAYRFATWFWTSLRKNSEIEVDQDQSPEGRHVLALALGRVFTTE
ncbi:hypothetical protein J6590_025608 [Homalodisca vitripennis]|nr:hypothetical protein J6590_025608 [Homalodisca vitripennis]